MDKEQKKMVGLRIARIRDKHNKTLEEFGKLIDGATKSNVSKWEKGEVLPNRKRLKMIADYDGIHVNELLHGDEKTYVYNVIMKELHNKGKLWFTISNYIKETEEITDDNLLRQKAIDLINEKFETIFSGIKKYNLLIRANTDNNFKTVYDHNELIIRQTVEQFSNKKEPTFEEYYNKIKSALGEIPISMTVYNIEQLTEQFLKKGFSNEEAFNKAVDKFFINKASDPISEFENAFDNLYTDYKSKLK